MTDLTQHDIEIQKNLESWNKKPTLRRVYKDFHQLIASHLTKEVDGDIVELGSGIGKIKEVIPECILTDLFPNPWVDNIENAYQLSFANRSLSNLILFDVFHHLKYPGTAFLEFDRVLKPKGRIIIFDPCISLLGLFVYGAMHHEPIAMTKTIEWIAPKNWSPEDDHYYAAQGNATRVFFSKQFTQKLSSWKVVEKRRMSAISYVATGGFSKIQFYPHKLFPCMKWIDHITDFFPLLFATRLLIVLEKSHLYLKS